MDFKALVHSLLVSLFCRWILKKVLLKKLCKSLWRKQKGRLHILGKMQEAVPAGRVELSDFAPRLITIKINPEKIRDVIGKWCSDPRFDGRNW